MTDNTQTEFTIQRIFIKDLSFESPQAPQVFQGDWQPEINVQLNTSGQALSEDAHEVILSVTVTAQSAGKTVFLIEVKQAGIFTIKGIPNDQLGHVLGSVCPSILFPYAREIISDLASRGTFPPLYLAPINFDALYAQNLAQQQANKSSEIITDATSH